MPKWVKRVLAASGAVLVTSGFCCSVVLRCQAFAWVPVAEGLSLAISLMLIYCGYVNACNEQGWSDNTVIENFKNTYLGSGAYAEDWSMGMGEIGNWFRNFGGAIQNLVGSWNETFGTDISAWDDNLIFGGYVFPEGLLYAVDSGFVVQKNVGYTGDSTKTLLWDSPYSFPYFSYAPGGINSTYTSVYAWVAGEFRNYRINDNGGNITLSGSGGIALYVDSRGSASYRNIRYPVVSTSFPVGVYDGGNGGNIGDYTFGEFQEFTTALGCTTEFTDEAELLAAVQEYYNTPVDTPVAGGEAMYPAKYAYPAAQDLGLGDDYIGGVKLDKDTPLTADDLQAGLDAVGAESGEDFLLGLHTGAYTPADVYTSMTAAGVTPYVLTDANTGAVVLDNTVAAGSEGVKAVALDSSLALPDAVTALAAPEYTPSDYSLVNPGHFQYPLFDYFPWCLPKDIYLIFADFLIASPLTPVVSIPIRLPNGAVDNIVIDLSQLDPIMATFRKFEVLAFCVGIVMFTRKVMH